MSFALEAVLEVGGRAPDGLAVLAGRQVVDGVRAALEVVTSSGSRELTPLAT